MADTHASCAMINTFDTCEPSDVAATVFSANHITCYCALLPSSPRRRRRRQRTPTVTQQRPSAAAAHSRETSDQAPPRNSMPREIGGRHRGGALGALALGARPSAPSRGPHTSACTGRVRRNPIGRAPDDGAGDAGAVTRGPGPGDATGDGAGGVGAVTRGPGPGDATGEGAGDAGTTGAA